MRLEELLEGVEGATVSGDPSIEIHDLAYDSRNVTPGALFFAVPGIHVDGGQFSGEALRKGAHAVVARRGEEKVEGGVFVEVEDVRKAMARMASRFFRDPSREIVLIGVTGTNGKTTVTFLLESVLKQAGFRPGVLGTISYRYNEKTQRPATTTPESVDLQRVLREMLDAGCTHALLEVSSHGLDYRRVDECSFSCAAFTMMGRDHLDHHGDMETYFASKARLFTEILPRSAVEGRAAILNVDDPYGRRLGEACEVPVVTVSGEGKADCRSESVSLNREGISMVVKTPRGELQLESPLLCEVNARNILMAAAVADHLGLDPGAVKEGIRALGRVPGRMERIGGDRDFLVLVDYAHTPDALEKVLSGLRVLTAGRLITVFGCGGDRDRGKRPLMGTAAARWSDLVLVTSDNPRSESPESIIAEIRQGIEAMGLSCKEPDALPEADAGTKAYTGLTDRREAIRLAIRTAVAGDTVLIAGKGHEDVQILGDTRIPFRDDREVLHALGDHDGKESALG